MYTPCKPRFKFDAREYRPDAPPPQQLDSVSLEPYVPARNTPATVQLHTRLPYRFGVLTAEPPAPPVSYSSQGTQTDPVVLAPEPACIAWPYVRSEESELRSDKIRLQRKVHALELRKQELLAEEKTPLEQLERAAEERRLSDEKARLEQFERAAEERTLPDEKALLEQLERAAEEKTRLEQLNMRRLERDQQSRQKLPQLPRVLSRPEPKSAKPATPAMPLARSRTHNRTGK
jgi:hypothetical protein